MEKNFGYGEKVIYTKPIANGADSRVYLLTDENLAIKIYHPHLLQIDVENYYKFLEEFKNFLTQNFSNFFEIPNFGKPNIKEIYDKNFDVKCNYVSLPLIEGKEFNATDFSNQKYFIQIIENLKKNENIMIKKFLEFLEIQKVKDLRDLFCNLLKFFVLQKYGNGDLSKNYLCSGLKITHSNVKFDGKKFIITDVDSIPNFLQTIKIITFFAKS